MTNTIPNVPRELLADLLGNDHDKRIMAERHLLAVLANAQSPAGVDGLGNTANLLLPALRQYMHNDGSGLLAGYDLETTQAIIDGLRGEVAGLRKRAKTAEREAGSALRTYNGLEKVARVVSDNSDQVCGELNVLRQQFDQQAQRICELDGLLLRVQVSLSLDDTEWGYSGAEKYKLLADIRAALSAGKEGE